MIKIIFFINMNHILSFEEVLEGICIKYIVKTMQKYFVEYIFAYLNSTVYFYYDKKITSVISILFIIKIQL